MATIADLLDERSIDLSLSSGDKDDAIERMVDLVDASGALLDRDVLIKAVRAREEAGTAVRLSVFSERASLCLGSLRRSSLALW